MGYGDTDQRQEEGSTGTKAQGTTTTTTTTTISGHGGNGGNGVTGQNGNVGNGETGITVEEIGLEALAGEWIYLYVPPFNEYIGPYHLMSDGTAMIGEGVLGEEHEINTDNVITYVGATDGSTDSGPPPSNIFSFQNLNPRRGDMVVTVNNDTTHEISSEGLELEIPVGVLVQIQSMNSDRVSRKWTGDFILLGLNEISNEQSQIAFVTTEINQSDPIVIQIDYDIEDLEALVVSRSEVREKVADIFYKKFFENNTLPEEQVLSMQSTIRDGKIKSGRTEDEPLVFYKKDRNTLESKRDIQGHSFRNIVEYVYARNLLLSEEPLENSFSPVVIGENYMGEELPEDTQLRDYTITFIPDNQAIVIATEVITFSGDLEMGSWGPSDPPLFTNVLNLSQLVKPKYGTKIKPEKAREVLDTNIFELLPAQTTRQDEIDKFFGDFNKLIGPPPATLDVDGDGVDEYVVNDPGDKASRVSYPEPTYEDLNGTFITRLDKHTNSTEGSNTEANQGKTIETMRNRLNLYLGDVDNVIETVSDQRPEYINKSAGFLKIRKPNQAIILRAPSDGLLEFQKENSYLTDGFTITMWVRFVSKTSEGTLFNFGNPLAPLGNSPMGFRLETRVTQNADKINQRWLRLTVREADNTLRDNHWGTQNHARIAGTAFGYYDNTIIHTMYPQISTENLDEWYFVCATYNPQVDEDYSIETTGFDAYKYEKQFWLNHVGFYEDGNPYYTSVGRLTDGTLLGAKSKVEVISRSELLRARGFKTEDMSYTATTQSQLPPVEITPEEDVEEETFAG